MRRPERPWLSLHPLPPPSSSPGARWSRHYRSVLFDCGVNQYFPTSLPRARYRVGARRRSRQTETVGLAVRRERWISKNNAQWT